MKKTKQTEKVIEIKESDINNFLTILNLFLIDDDRLKPITSHYVSMVRDSSRK